MPGELATAAPLAALPVIRTDVLILGAGVAGLQVALHLSGVGRVLLLSKGPIEASNSFAAQGGVAAALGPGDSPAEHLADTLAAGAGLCDRGPVEILTGEGPDRVRELLSLGASFDRSGQGLSLGLEAAHRRPRVVHAGDHTGAEVSRTVLAAAQRQGVPPRAGYQAVELLVAGGRCQGALVLNPFGQPVAVMARATVLASGGAGQLYPVTTNPGAATADGIALAYQAGAEVADLEFVQFHPTAMAVPGAEPFLITEALRGAGAYLVTGRGRRFMPEQHPLAELAPRDVVARAIGSQQAAGETVYLDARHVPEMSRRFPTVAGAARERGYDLAREPVPVTPAAHYHMGGVVTDHHGRTTLPGLYACGETACTGVHGANRLASNSLLEALVFGARVARAVAADLSGAPGLTAGAPARSGAAVRPAHLPLAAATERPTLAGDLLPDSMALQQTTQSVMWQHVGMVRAAAGLGAAVQELSRLAALARDAAYQSLTAYRPQGGLPQAPTPVHAAFSAANLALVASLVARAALGREESRGAHFRTDFPGPNDAAFRRHSIQSLAGGLTWRDQIWN